MHLEDRIFTINSDDEFERTSLDVFSYQYDRIRVYREFCNLLGKSKEKVNTLTEIPFIPIEFFKSHVIRDNTEFDKVFLSSGTTGQERSKHYISDLKVYERSFHNAFSQFYGDPSDFLIAAIIPGYVDNPDSSLLYMVDKLIRGSKDELSGFYNFDDEKLIAQLKNIRSSHSKNKLIIGVSFALLAIAERHSIDLSDCIIMETGGMKGKRQELVREELHNILKTSFKVDDIHSEYGMTELLSQAYSKGNGVFDTPNSMDVRIRDIYQPMSLLPNGQAGGINIIDLSNLYSVSFIATQDLGKKLNSNQFEVIGRFDHSDIRGCNLLLS
jgi:hypothetical protein